MPLGDHYHFRKGGWFSDSVGGKTRATIGRTSESYMLDVVRQ
jgi:hypothetical protein